MDRERQGVMECCWFDGGNASRNERCAERTKDELVSAA